MATLYNFSEVEGLGQKHFDKNKELLGLTKLVETGEWQFEELFARMIGAGAGDYAIVDPGGLDYYVRRAAPGITIITVSK